MVFSRSVSLFLRFLHRSAAGTATGPPLAVFAGTMVGVTLFCVMLAAGLALMLSLTPPDQVHPGYFRGTFLVTLGLVATGGVAGWADLEPTTKGLLIAGVALSYLAFVAWHYEAARVGRALAVALVILLNGLLMFTNGSPGASPVLSAANSVAGGMLLGAALGDMLLGHYYLTAPWMSLRPLERVALLIWGAAALRAGVAGWALWEFLGRQSSQLGPGEWGLFFALRWFLGIAGPIALTFMIYQTIRLRHTQAATGILYVVVICSFLGEATGIAMERLTGVPL